jgi:PEP-CTERM motif
MHLNAPLKLALAAACLATAGTGHAIGVTDATGDWAASYSATGPRAGDLDVIGAFVTYNPDTGGFVFSGTMDDDIGTTAGAVYVFGVNRGAGTARFGAAAPGVTFDAVVVVNPAGSSSINLFDGNPAQTLPTGAFQSFGSTVIGTVAGSLLPSTGFAPTAYTWNLWPRAPGISGVAGIPDFAPDNSMVGATNLTPVPEPGTWALLAGGLALLGLRARRQRAQAGA